MESLTLIQKLAKIRTMSDAVTKGLKGYNYKYADITEILAKVTAGMKKYNVSLIPIIRPETFDIEKMVVTNTRVDKTGKPFENTTTEMLVCAEMIFKWINDDNQEDFIEVPWLLTGMQSDPSQAFGSGITYCTRYFLTSYFQIAQPEGDVDKYRTKQKEAEIAEEVAAAKGIIEQFDLVLKKYLSDNPNKSDDIKEFIGRYAKNSNYLAIKEPTLASKLLDDFNKTFLSKKKGE